jgi:hypothetical protein
LSGNTSSVAAAAAALSIGVAGDVAFFQLLVLWMVQLPAASSAVPSLQVQAFRMLTVATFRWGLLLPGILLCAWRHTASQKVLAGIQPVRVAFEDCSLPLLLLLLLLLLCLSPGEGSGGGARAVAETVQHFITAMDSLKLNLVAVDQVQGWFEWG